MFDHPAVRPNRKSLAGWLLAALPLLAMLPAAAWAQAGQTTRPPAPAQSDSAPASVRTPTWSGPRQPVALTVGAGKLLRLPSPAGSVILADPSIADVQTPGESEVFVFGRKPGRTTLLILSRGGATIASYLLTVELDQSALQSAFRAEAGDLPVRLVRVPHGLILEGTVPTPAAAARLQSVAQGYLASGETLVNQLRVGSPVQVNLRVRVAEVSRSVSRSLGFNWAALFRAGSFLIGLQTNPVGAGAGFANQAGTLFSNGGNIGASVGSRDATGTLVLDAMANEGLVTMLAEPNLTTTSGEAATFLAGGQFPIPVPQALGVTSIEYKNYGVSVGFTPTVLSTGTISMKVSPEVSSLSTAGQSTINGTTVPALISRRAETTVQLASGQSFAIAGLLQNNASNNIQKIPWLGDIPILGALFRSTQFQRDQTELLIVVTAYVVQPSDQIPPLPTDEFRQPTDFERLLLGRVASRAGPAADPVRAPILRGSAGFLFE